MRFSFKNDGSLHVYYDKRFDSLPPDKAALSRLLGNVRIAEYAVMEWVMWLLRASEAASMEIQKMLEQMPVDGMEVN